MWAQFRLGLGLVVRFYDARHDSQHYTIPRCLGPPHRTPYLISFESSPVPYRPGQTCRTATSFYRPVARHTFCQRHCVRVMLAQVLLAALAAPKTRPGEAACTQGPSCANNPMTELLDKYCSDKGTFWQSKHHYPTAYHSIFGSLRGSITSILEVGIGEDTSPSAATWIEYFPRAQIYLIDIKTTKEVTERAKPGGHTDGVAKHQALFGCEYNRSMWSNPRVHLFLDTDASKPEQLEKLGGAPGADLCGEHKHCLRTACALPVHCMPVACSLPPHCPRTADKLPKSLDIVIDDGSHKYLDQDETLHTLWPRLREGGFYIVEDVVVGALPWDAAHAKQVPTINDNCGAECFFPQRLAEHPFMHDRFGYLKNYDVGGKARSKLSERSAALFKNNDWWWAITGVHQGGGLDAALIIRKRGPAILPQAASASASASSPPIALPPAVAAAAPVAASGADTVAQQQTQQARRALALAETQMAEIKARHTQMADALLRAQRLGREGTAPDDAQPSCNSQAGHLPWLLLLVSLAAHGYQMRKRRGVAKVTT